MKISPLLAGFVGVTLVALTATTLYAQTVAGSSIVDKMKAAARNSFALSADLNPGQTGFDSAPVSGKKTGNMLTAGEWNRMLELISEGGSGGGSGWVNVPLEDTTDFDISCEYKFGLNLLVDDVNRKWMNSTSMVGHPSSFSNKFLAQHLVGTFYYGIPSANKNQYGTRDQNGVFTNYTNVSVTNIQKRCGGGGGTGGGDKFTFLDADILLHSSGVTKIDKTTPVALDLSAVSGVTLPSGIKAVQLHVICNNYTAQNEAVSLNVGRSPTAMLRVCQQNVMGAANDVDTNTVYIPIADDKKTLYYSYQVPSTDTGGQIAVYLRGFITQ